MKLLAGLADDNAKVQAAAVNMLNLALTLPEAPSDLDAILVRFLGNEITKGKPRSILMRDSDSITHHDGTILCTQK